MTDLPTGAVDAVLRAMLWAEAEASVALDHDPRCQTICLDDLPDPPEACEVAASRPRSAPGTPNDTRVVRTPQTAISDPRGTEPDR